MSKVAAAFGGVLSAVMAVLTVEAWFAHWAINAVDVPPTPDPSGFFGHDGDPEVTVAVIGDSTATGYGLVDVAQTPGHLIATAIAVGAQRRVRLHDLSIVGAHSYELGPQIDKAIAIKADVAMICIGALDVVKLLPPRRSAEYLARAIGRLREHNIAVVVGTCPDLGLIRPFYPPLRQIARFWSRRIAARQIQAAVATGATPVAMGRHVAETFKGNPAALFGLDQFHPSALGYRVAIESMVPAMIEAVVHRAPDHIREREEVGHA